MRDEAMVMLLIALAIICATVLVLTGHSFPRPGDDVVVVDQLDECRTVELASGRALTVCSRLPR